MRPRPIFSSPFSLPSFFFFSFGCGWCSLGRESTRCEKGERPDDDYDDDYDVPLLPCRMSFVEGKRGFERDLSARSGEESGISCIFAISIFFFFFLLETSDFFLFTIHRRLIILSSPRRVRDD